MLPTGRDVEGKNGQKDYGVGNLAQQRLRGVKEAVSVPRATKGAVNDRRSWKIRPKAEQASPKAPK